MSELFERIGEIIQELIGALGYGGIFLATLIETIFPPIPSEVIMPFGGFLVGRGELSFVGVVAAGTLAAVLGSIFFYYLGLWADEHIIRSLIRRYGRYLSIREADLDRALAVFSKYGEAVIFFGRLIPLVRTFISVPAGMKRMPLPKFLLFTTLGTVLWNAGLAYVGVVMGENWEEVLGLLKTYERVMLVMIALVVVVVAGILVMRYLRSRAAAREGQPSELS